MKLNKIPSIVKNVPLSGKIEIGSRSCPKRELVILVEALDDAGKTMFWNLPRADSVNS